MVAKTSITSPSEIEIDEEQQPNHRIHLNKYVIPSMVEKVIKTNLITRIREPQDVNSNSNVKAHRMLSDRNRIKILDEGPIKCLMNSQNSS